ncbi:MAG: hypothetical protein M3394_01645 [Actinomycetota bacterium]|nr:hypothetical protein [Actinomycetota bacterium]
MKRRLFALVLLLGSAAPLASSPSQAEPLPGTSGTAVPLTLTEPCRVDLRTLPDPPDLPDPSELLGPSYPGWNTIPDKEYQRSDLVAPPLLLGPATASTVPAAWSNGGVGAAFVNGMPGLAQDRWPEANTQVAADDDFVMQATTSRVRITERKTGRPAVTYDLATFMATPPDCATFDHPEYRMPTHPDRWFAWQPTVYRDARSGRWFVAASVFSVAENGARSGYVRLAVSLTPDPTAGYALYTVSPRPPNHDDLRYYDYPKFSVTDDKVVLAYDVYDDRTFMGSQTMAVLKPPLLGATPATASVFDIDPHRRRMHPALDYGPGTAAYVAGLGGSNGSVVFDVVDGIPGLDVRRTTNTVAVTPWTAPPKAQQPLGGSLDSGGGVLQAPAFHNGSWWGSVTEGCAAPGVPSRFACVRMWQFSVDAAGRPTVRQEFDIAEPGFDLTYPASVVDAHGSVTTVLSRMGPDGFPGISVVGQAVGSPVNTVSRPVRTVGGLGQYNNSFTWGSYAGAARAPDGTRIWLAHLRSNDGPWTTELLELQSTPVTAWPTPARLAMTPGSSATSTITLKSIAGWSGNVTLGLTGVPAGSSATLSASSRSVPAGGSTTVTLSVTAGVGQASDFPVTVRACASGLCQLVDVTAQIQQFAVSVRPAAPVIEPGKGNVSTLTVSSAHGWAGTVSLDTTSSSPSTTAKLDRTSLAVPAGQSASAAVTLHVDAGETALEVPITVRACASYCRSTEIRVLVSQFGLYPTPQALSVSPGSTGSSTVIVSSSHAWQGTVALSVTGAPAGTGATLSASSVTLGQYEAKSITLTVDLPASQTTGFYLKITGCAASCRTTYVRVNLPNPSVALSPERSYYYLHPGSQFDIPLSVTSVDGFAGTASLSTSGVPSGSSATVTPNVVTVTPDAGAEALVTIRVGATQATNFTVVVTVRPPDGSFERNAYFTVGPT